MKGGQDRRLSAAIHYPGRTVASAWRHRHRPVCSRLTARGAAAPACAVIPNGTPHPLRLPAITGDGCQLFRIGHSNST
jgi:hypothetical protein